jgi:ERI1 exoribonuclease 3
MVEKGKNIEEVLEDFYKWIEKSEFLKQGNFALVTCGDWDLSKCLKFEAKVKKLNIPKYMKSYINIKDYCGKVLKLKETPRRMM